MGLNREAMRFDKRLTTRNLREGTLSLDDLNEYLGQLEDSFDMAAPDDNTDAAALRAKQDEESDT